MVVDFRELLGGSIRWLVNSLCWSTRLSVRFQCIALHEATRWTFKAKGGNHESLGCKKKFSNGWKAEEPYCTSWRGWKEEAIPKQLTGRWRQPFPGKWPQVLAQSTVHPGTPGEPGFASLYSSRWVTFVSPGFLQLGSTRTLLRAAVLAWESGITCGFKVRD